MDTSIIEVRDKLFYLIFLVSISGCDSGMINISKLESKKNVSYDQLPVPVQDVFAGISPHVKKNEQSLVICMDSVSVFLLETKKTGPWVDYHILVNNIDTSKKYKIDYGKPFPYVIHRNILYISNDFNVYNLEKARNSSYDIFYLK